MDSPLPAPATFRVEAAGMDPKAGPCEAIVRATGWPAGDPMLTPSKSRAEEAHPSPSPANGPVADETSAIPSFHRGDPLDETILEGLTQTFVAFGLSAREARLYVTLADKGSASAREAIRESGLDRATSYRIIDRLEARGLVTSDNRWPARYSAVGIQPMLDRMSALLRDEIELLQSIRDLYDRAASARTNGKKAEIKMPANAPPVERTRLLADYDSSITCLVNALRSAEQEIVAVVRPSAYRRIQADLIARAMCEALGRGVKLRLILNYRSIDLKFLGNLMENRPSTPSDIEVRFFVPQLLHLYLVDRRTAIRFLGFPGAPSHGPEVGLETSDPNFVRTQTFRFRNIWNHSAPERVPSSGSATEGGETFLRVAPANRRADPSRPINTGAIHSSGFDADLGPLRPANGRTARR